MPYPKNKYRKGFVIYRLDELWEMLDNGQWVYWRDRPKHPGFIMSMPFRVLAKAIEATIICGAIDQQKEYYANR